MPDSLPILSEPGLPPTTIAVIPRHHPNAALVAYWDASHATDSPWLLRLTLFNRSSTGRWHERDERRAFSVSVFPEQIPALIAALHSALERT